MDQEFYAERVRYPASKIRRSGSRCARGFTLLELVVTVAIVASILGLGAFSLARLVNDQEFEKSAADLKRMARQAAGLASTRGRESVIRLEASGAALYRQVSEKPVEEIRLPDDIRLFVRPWGGNRWLRPDRYEWVFDGNGLSEPLQVRFERGESWIEVDFHPLAGGVREERMTIPNRAR